MVSCQLFADEEHYGISALSLSHHLRVSYNTAWSLKHKLMQVMLERERQQPLLPEALNWMTLTGVANMPVNADAAAKTRRPFYRPRKQPTMADPCV